ncbi:MAG: calcium-binding protein, partial [Planctomycetes bacterium]|nr:calcium-binding protein [Planctomycetota bacterium]
IDVPQGTETLSDQLGADTISFVGSVAPVILNLGTTTQQILGGGTLNLTLSSADEFDNIIGGNGSDQLTGNSRGNSLEGRGGNDTLSGGAGNDSYAFDADTNIGSDLLIDSTGIDTLRFSAMSSAVNVNLGLTTPQSINGGRLTLTLASSTSFENVIGGLGNDTLIGNSAINSLTGGAGNDTLIGMNGDDTYQFDADLNLGVDTIDETSTGGTDTLSFISTDSTAITVDLSSTLSQAVSPTASIVLTSGSSVENIMGGARSDTLTGNGLNNSLSGGAGNDTINGGSGNDNLTGGSGDDQLNGGLGDDTYTLDADAQLGTDTIDESLGGIDTISYSLTTTQTISIDLSIPTNQVINPRSSLILGSSTAIENITGGFLDDTLIGNTLANVIAGNGGNDSMFGGSQNDVYLFDEDVSAGSDVITDASG